MSYQINSINEEINDLNEREQFNDFQPDNEQYFLFNGQGSTPQGDEIDMNMNINIDNSFNNNINNNNFYEHLINNNDNAMDNEYSAAPVPLRRREADISINNQNIIINSNLDNNHNNIDIEKSLSASNNIFQNGLKNIVENIENEEKYLNLPFAHNDFSCFNPNFLDSDKDMPNCLLIEEENKINNINNENNEINEEKSNININLGVEKITPFSGMNESINLRNQGNSESSQNINIKDAPVNNNLSYSSSSQNTNVASLSNINNNNNKSQNSLLFSSKMQIISNLGNNNTFDPGKHKNENILSTKYINSNSIETFGEKTKKKKIIRKFKPDSMRKKIKARMHKKLKDIINKKLKDCGSKMFFEYLPQPFITNVNVTQNKAYLKLTMRTLFKMIFGNKTKDKEKVKMNLKVINYLDSNDIIRVQSGVEEFLNSTYEEIISRYVNGKLFEDDIKKLYKEGETKEYIDKYSFIGKHWNEFYNNNGKILIME